MGSVVNLQGTSVVPATSTSAQHDITVTVVNGKYVFSPEVTNFVEGDVYVFDNTANGSHPLNFHDTNETNATFVYQQAANGFVTVDNFSGMTRCTRIALCMRIWGLW